MKSRENMIKCPQCNCETENIFYADADIEFNTDYASIDEYYQCPICRKVYLVNRFYKHVGSEIIATVDE